MDAVITELVGGSGLTSATFYSQITDLVPFIVLLVPIAFGFYELRKLIKGAAKAKVRV